MSLHPHTKGSQTSQGQPGIQRGGRQPHHVGVEGYQVDVLLVRGDHRAADDVGVTVKELGVRGNNEISVKAEWLLQNR